MLETLECRRLMALVTATASGNWTSATTWGGAVPLGGDDVVVPAGTTVTYNQNAATAYRSVSVLGTLDFKRDADTRLVVGFLKIGETALQNGVFEYDCVPTAPRGGRLLVGVPGSPIQAGKTALIELATNTGWGLDTAEAPTLMNCGGEWTMQGATLKNPWTTLATDATTGSTSVTLAAGVDISDWNAGDTILLAGTNNGRGNFSRERTTYRAASPRVADGTYTYYGTPKSEERTISSISGQTITLSSSLSFNHQGLGGMMPQVANLSRNVTVRSLDRSTDVKRGSTMYHRYSSGSLAFARFDGLGKEGVLGKYPVHLHKVLDTMRGFTATGLSVTDSHNKGIVLHNSHHAVVRDCVVYAYYTHGFFLEDGSETYNVLDHNLAVLGMAGVAPSNDVLEFSGGDGSGFWWANGRNTFTNNSTAEQDDWGFQFEVDKVRYYYGTYVGTGTPSTGYPDTLDIVPMLQEDGTSPATTSVKNIPFFKFDGNWSQNQKAWASTFTGGNWTRTNPSIVKNFKVYAAHYPLAIDSEGVRVEDYWVKGANYAFDTEPNYNAGYDSVGNFYGKNLTLIDAGTGSGGVFSMELSAMADGIFENVTFNNAGRITLPWVSSKRYMKAILNGITNVGTYPLTLGDNKATRVGSELWLNDYYGTGQAAKITRSDFAGSGTGNINDGLSYAYVSPPNTKKTGDTIWAVTAQTANTTSTTDPLAGNVYDSTGFGAARPATTISGWGANPQNLKVTLGTGGTIVVEGFASDNGSLATVKVKIGSTTVNATAFASGGTLAHWKANLTGLSAGATTVDAWSIDAKGNTELIHHVIPITLQAPVAFRAIAPASNAAPPPFKKTAINWLRPTTNESLLA